MNELRLTPEAKADLAEIRRFGVKRWGAKQARSYLSSMGVAFRRAAANPKLVP